MTATATTTRRRSAELILTERDWNGYGLPGWTGRFLGDARDRTTGQVARNYIARIDWAPRGRAAYHADFMDGYGQPAPVLGHLEDGSPVYADSPYTVTLQARSRYARRTTSYATLAEAQAALASWAGRTFYVEA